MAMQGFKSDNLQYNTLVRWVAVTNNSATKRLTIQVFFFIVSYRLMALKTLCFYFRKFIKKIYIQTIFVKNFARNHEEKEYLELQSTSQLSQQTSELAYYIVD